MCFPHGKCSQCSVGCHVLPHSLPVSHIIICHGLGGASRALWALEGHLELRTGHSGVGPCGFGNPTATSTHVPQYPQTALSGVSAALPVLHLPADFTMGPSSSSSSQAWNFLEDCVSFVPSPGALPWDCTWLGGFSLISVPQRGRLYSWPGPPWPSPSLLLFISSGLSLPPS